jgi:hypothetical protein
LHGPDDDATVVAPSGMAYETRRYMRVLHEDVIARIAALGDARR